jgi:hypothetical protein
MDEAPICSFLERIRREGRSSPAGQHWATFHDLLSRHAGRVGAVRPPMPLILAASGESDESKFHRLAEQLRWAKVNGFLTEALQYLDDLQTDHWNHCSMEDWHRSTY